MQLLVIQRILGLLMMVFSTALLPPVLTGLIYGDGAVLPFIESFFLILVCGFLLWLPVRRERKELRLRDGFLVVVLFWIVGVRAIQNDIKWPCYCLIYTGIGMGWLVFRWWCYPTITMS